MKNKQEYSSLSVYEAVETLTTIADLDISDLDMNKASLVKETTQPFEGSKAEVGLKEPKEKGLTDSSKKTVTTLKQIFTVLLHYLRSYYKGENKDSPEPQAVEGIKTIMVLVEEAVKKIDLYTSLFYQSPHSVTQTKEYKLLQDFYRHNVQRQKVDARVMQKWSAALSERAVEKRSQEENLEERVVSYKFVDLEALKQDIEYELLFIRKEDGSHFFSPRLLRNMKLVCDFSASPMQKDPLVKIRNWQDEALQRAAADLLKNHSAAINRFYKEAFRFRHRELVGGVHNCLMALMLCRNKANLYGHEGKKSSFDYFSDFLHFLRGVLLSADYMQLLLTTSNAGSGANASAMSLVYAFCRSLYLDLNIFSSLSDKIENMLSLAQQGQDQPVDDSISAQLASDYEAIQGILKFHPSGPLKKMLGAFESGSFKAFDPLIQGNYPSKLYAIHSGGQSITNIHLPSPTHQEYINRAQVLDEFKDFLRAYGDESSPETHLLINLQDRTSWLEHTRSVVLEELASQLEFQQHLIVVTLAKETAFAHQAPPYDQDTQIELFARHFKEHFGDEASGYFFPPAIGAMVLSNFAQAAFDAIHKIFFSGKNVLTKEQRLNFIEVFDLFLILKLLDLTRPSSFSFSCKDGIDLGASNSALLYLFLKILGTSSFNKADWQLLNTIIYGPGLIIRERAMHSGHFQRMLGAFNTIEFVYREQGPENFVKLIKDTFGHLYNGSILQSKVVS